MILIAGREAFGRGAWGEAYRQLAEADAARTLDAGDLELLASSAYLIGKDRAGDELWVRAHNEYLRQGAAPRAARCAFWLVLNLIARGELAQASGWLARAHHMLDDGRRECPELGLLQVLTAKIHHLKRDDAKSAEAAVGRAVELARRFDDPDLNAFSRLILGQDKVRKGAGAEAVTLFDEAMVAVTVGEVSPLSIGWVYCAVIDTCHHIFDVERAREWTAALSRMCSAQPDVVLFRGPCLVHRAEILRLSGDWTNAMKEAEAACGFFTRGDAPDDQTSDAERQLPFAHLTGAALYELGEIHRMRGDLEKAAEAYRQGTHFGQSAEPGLALVRLAQGQLSLAERAIRRVIDERQNPRARARTLAACVDIMVASNDLPAARAAADELVALGAALDSPYLRALGGRCLGAVLLAEGNARVALAELRTAWMTCQEIDAPYEAACVRVLLGLVCRDLGDDDTAELELDAARRVFQRLAAAPDVTRVNALLSGSTRPGSSALTPRELEVIGLVATGKTNRDIAIELSISERTVDRHVSNILMKLDLSSRSAATAYAFEHGLV
jgi:DNA-binding CsgD family transcriptional regulator